MKSPFTSEHQKKYFFNTGWLLGEKALRIVVNFIVGIQVTRYLGPESFGLINYALAYIFLFQPIANLGLGDIIVRELVKSPDEEKKILGTSLLMRALGSFSVISVVLFSTFLFEGDQTQANFIYIIAIANIFQIGDVLDRYFQARLKSRISAKANSISILLLSAIKLSLVYFHAPVWTFAVAQILDFAFVSIALSYFFRQLGFSVRELTFSFSLAKTMISQSWSFILSGIMVVIYMRIDQVMIRNFLDIKAVGNFTAGVKLSEAHYVLPQVLLASLFPAIINGKSLGEAEYNKRLQKLLDLLTWTAVPIALVLSIFATPLTDFLYGAKFQGEDAVLAIHIWAGVFVFWGSVVNKWLIIEGLPRYVTVCTLLGCSVNIVLNLILINKIGIAGAAIATVCAQFSAVFLSLSFTKHTRRLQNIMLQSFNIIRVGKNYFALLKHIIRKV